MKTVLGYLVLLLIATPVALAQGGNVFGPAVDADDRLWEWRVIAVLGEDEEWSGATRLHYQHALNDALRLRGVGQFEQDGQNGFQADFARAELLWQYQEETAAGYQAAFRLDARLNAQGAHNLRLAWVQQLDFSEGWRLRGVVLADHQIGAGSRNGLRLSHRVRLSRRFTPQVNAGLESFGRFGNLSDGLPGFEQQSHTAGPALFGSFNARWRWHVTSQWALSRAASDRPLRAQLQYRF
ncbi:transporter [Hyphobacterium sp.]|uniref:transporter n=1 Tax=Hyphobacterium sp. TaxID=2004662 RepID=UPI003BAB464A